MIDYTQSSEALAWAESILGCSFKDTPATWLTSRDQNGTILGVVIFSRFTTGNCEITVASSTPRFISKRFAYAVALYPFVQLSCRRVTAFVAVDNEKSLRLAQQLGFRIEGTVKEWFPNSDAYILGLLRKDCKWIKDSNGQPLPASNT